MEETRVLPVFNGGATAATSTNRDLEQISAKVNQIEQKINEIEQFYSNSSSSSKNPDTPRSVVSSLRTLDRDKVLNNLKKRQQDALNREAAAAKRMRELMRQFGVILDKISEHKWAAPFLQPVDVVGLGLHDYYQVIEKPMDFCTIKSKMEAKDGLGYKNVREICADVRLIFKNAMKYNDEKNDVHVMAKSLLDKFETRWLQLLPKVDEEERRLKDEEAEMQLDQQLVQEVQHAKSTRDLCAELEDVDGHLEKLKETLISKCRKMTTEEKKRLGSAITKLSPEDINKALEIIAQSNQNFQASGETVEVNIDAQSESTLWKLKFFVKETLQQSQMKTTTEAAATVNNPAENHNKRKRDHGNNICDAAIAGKNSSQKKCKKPN